MKSITKFKISNDQIKTVFNAAGIDVGEISEITDGWYNSVFEVAGLSGKRYVIKIAPHKSVKVLRHERDIMQAELNFYHLLREQTTIKTPNIVLEDFSEQIIPTSYFIMEFLNGTRLDKTALSPTDIQSVEEQWASILAQFHKINGEGYGYGQAGLSNNWRDALTHMTQMLISDCASFGKKCKVGTRLLGYIKKFAPVLNDVPCVLVNFDLHAKNMFFQRGDNGDISLALVDLERCFWGDPLGDFIYLKHFIKKFSIKNILSFYCHSFQKDTILQTREEQIRLNLLTAYLATIMYTERFSRFKSFKKFFSIDYLAGTGGYKLLSNSAFKFLKNCD
jgi:aminoglycoside phosphotransferase (APT) family kinase protein